MLTATRPLLLGFVLLAPLAPMRGDEPAVAIPGAAPQPATAPAIAERLPTAVDPNNLTPAESMAWRDLREVVLRERAIWERLRAKPDDELEQQRANADFRHVMTAYENVIRSAPKFAEAYAAYALLLSRTGNRDEALAVFLKANELNRNLPMVKNQIGNHLFEDGRYKEALGYYLAAVELKPDEPLYHYQLGTLLREYRRFFIDDALFAGATLDAKMQEAFRRAADLSPDTWAFAYRYAESFYDLETPDWPAALAEWTKLEARAKPGVEKQAIHLHQANVLARLGRRDEARALVDSIVEPSLLASKAEVLALIDPPPETGAEVRDTPGPEIESAAAAQPAAGSATQNTRPGAAPSPETAPAAAETPPDAGQSSD